jgi:hypothetical protein
LAKKLTFSDYSQNAKISTLLSSGATLFSGIVQGCQPLDPKVCALQHLT